MPWEAFKAESWGNHRSHLTCFLPLRDHCPSLPDDQRFIHLIWFIIVSGGRVNPVPVTLSRLKAEVLKATLDLP